MGVGSIGFESLFLVTLTPSTIRAREAAVQDSETSVNKMHEKDSEDSEDKMHEKNSETSANRLRGWRVGDERGEGGFATGSKKGSRVLLGCLGVLRGEEGSHLD